uniref:cytochrome c oxidase subunit III n=1 Tax=Euhemisphaerius bistriatus TaxID=3081096 RepID=UPI002E77D97C|nr:cytochrome c oxidase subunit III [Epyhemisphaerius bistriatus]WQB38522.1 cytochrome c oxidase subunit III [Epyhemisphaerius bistriatus]
MKKNHPFHLVTKSPWPIISSINLMTTLLGMVIWMTKKEMNVMLMGMTMTTISSILWWRDVIRESTFQGNHTKKVIKGIKMGMILFITSEVMFFISFFWSFLHSSISPSIELGLTWPPKSIQPFNPLEVPLLNTIILLSSGVSVTWTHQSILSSKLKKSINSLSITIMLGVYFTLLQKWEYEQSTFSISDSIYGSTFFLSTGFHGIHVIVGTLFLMLCLARMITLHFSKTHHLGFELASWYWHFVDVVWLMLYLMIYWWSK